MKKWISVLWMLLLVVNNVQGQPTEKLTNSTILKMVSAKLSDDLIIGEIEGSEVNFNLSPDSVNYLITRNISPAVLQAMKVAFEKQSPQILVEPVVENPVQPIFFKEKDAELKPEPGPTAMPEPEAIEITVPVKQSVTKASAPQKPAIEKANVSVVSMENEPWVSVDAMNYAIPVTELMLFFDQEFSSLAGNIQGWDTKVRNSIENARQLLNNLRQVDTQLTEKKNADAKAFSNEIASLKNQRSIERAKCQQFKKQMLTEGMNIIRQLKEMGSEMDHSISNKFNAVSNTVRSVNPDPSSIISKPVTMEKQKVDPQIINYIAPVTEMMVFCQNEILFLKQIIQQKNDEIIAVNQKDAALASQLVPLQKQMVNLQVNAKKNKKEISALKKHCAELEKERKGLGQQMEKNSKEFSKQLEMMGKEVQATVEERYAEIIDNINYLYLDNFSGF